MVGIKATKFILQKLDGKKVLVKKGLPIKSYDRKILWNTKSS